jgi:hypothetical protein
MINLPIDTAVVVPVNLVPLVDSADPAVIEDAVAYNASGMALKWNFVTPAGVQTQTAVTPTTSGVYDWSHKGGGIYSIEIPASGGASINNNTIGYGWFSGFVTGVLPWCGPVIAFSVGGGSDVQSIDGSADAATRWKRWALSLPPTNTAWNG